MSGSNNIVNIFSGTVHHCLCLWFSCPVMSLSVTLAPCVFIAPPSEIDVSSPLTYGTPSSRVEGTPRSGIRGTPARQRPDLGSVRKARQVDLHSDRVGACAVSEERGGQGRCENCCSETDSCWGASADDTAVNVSSFRLPERRLLPVSSLWARSWSSGAQTSTWGPARRSSRYLLNLDVCQRGKSPCLERPVKPLQPYPECITGPGVS